MEHDKVFSRKLGEKCQNIPEDLQAPASLFTALPHISWRQPDVRGTPHLGPLLPDTWPITPWGWRCARDKTNPPESERFCFSFLPEHRIDPTGAANPLEAEPANHPESVSKAKRPQ